jgi:hypothetical protein
MKCELCNKKIKRSGYKWLGKIHCYVCFERERNKVIDVWNKTGKFPDIDWNYDIVEVPKSNLQKWLK